MKCFTLVNGPHEQTDLSGSEYLNEKSCEETVQVNDDEINPSFHSSKAYEETANENTNEIDSIACKKEIKDGVDQEVNNESDNIINDGNR